MLPTTTAAPTPSPLDASYRQALTLAASDPEAALPLLNQLAFSDSTNAEQARSLWQAIQSARIFNNSAYLLTKSGQALAAIDEWEFASHSFLKAVELDPDYAEAWAYLGEARQQVGQDGLPALLQAQRLDPSSLSVRLFLALYWQRRGDYKQADLNLRIAAQHFPENALIQIQLGQNAVLAGEGPEGLKYFENALGLAPEDPAIWSALATYSVDTELYVPQIGLPSAQKLIAQFPGDPAVLALSARAYALSGDKRTADALFRQSLRFEPFSLQANLHYGIFLLANGEAEAARLHLNQVLALAPESSEARLASYWLEQISH